jgi:hypothetical protein
MEGGGGVTVNYMSLDDFYLNATLTVPSVWITNASGISVKKKKKTLTVKIKNKKDRQTRKPDMFDESEARMKIERGVRENEKPHR